MCRVLGVSRSGYYAWEARKPSERAREDEAIGAEIRAVHAKSRGRYGSPRVHAALRAKGRRVARKRVERLMREAGLRARRKRRFRRTTDSAHSLPLAPNLLARDFTASAPNRAWVGDITYLWTAQGWLYLAVLIDLFSRRVVGWALSERIDEQLALDALNMALHTRRPPRGLVHHTDRGSQYASRAYRAVLRAAGIRRSMSRKGDCWDNAVAESFFAALKEELVEDVETLTRAEARKVVFEYIESFYNRERLHSTNAYTSPVNFEVATEMRVAA